MDFEAYYCINPVKKLRWRGVQLLSNKKGSLRKKEPGKPISQKIKENTHGTGAYILYIIFKNLFESKKLPFLRRAF